MLVCVCVAEGDRASRKAYTRDDVFYVGALREEKVWPRQCVVTRTQKATHRRFVSHLLLLTFPLFTAHCRDTPFDSAAHT